MLEAALDLHQTAFGSTPELVTRAPGRVNLIGDHTDYNDGFVLPMAIDRAVWIAVGRRKDRLVDVVSHALGRATFDLSSLARQGSFVDYLSGVAWALGADRLPGIDVTIVSDVPVGAGLSSSAALGVGTALAFTKVAGLAWEPVPAALSVQRAENDWVGVTSGIMDQFISATAELGHASLIDCRLLVGRAVPVPDEVEIVILDSGTRRQLTASLYNERRHACERVAKALGVAKLRDVSAEQLAADKTLDPTDRRRARHVVTENDRTLAAADALARGDSERFGVLMSESHASLRDEFEVSTAALDAIVAAAEAAPGCAGARLTGAGMGGCGVALVAASQIEEFKAAVEAGSAASGRSAILCVTRPTEGASVVWRK